MSQISLIRFQPRDDSFYVSQNQTVLATDRHGFILGAAQQGLFVHETRMLSRYRYLIDGQPPLHIALSNVQQHSWLGYYMVGDAQRCVELRVSRFVGDGFHEDLDFTNFTGEPATFQLAIELNADFADFDETSGRRLQNGEVSHEWSANHALIFRYSAIHDYDQQGNRGTAKIERSVQVQIENSGSPASFADGRISFEIRLQPLASWHTCLNFIATIDGVLRPLMYRCRSFVPISNEWDTRREYFNSNSTSFSGLASGTLSNTVVRALEQAKADLAALRLYDLDRDASAWTVAAGLPVYVALFGRDTLTVAWEGALLSTDLMKGTLPELAKLQGRETNDWRDEEPGRMLHEAHTGPLKVLNFDPRARSYGSVTTSGFYPVLVAELWHWTGDKNAVEPFLEPALKALRWADQYSDVDHDGFYEYKTHSIQGVENQAWKDSGDAVVYEDGSQVKAPIAACEEQAFIYIAKFLMSEVLWWFDRKEEASRMYHEAAELKKRFNEAFWMEDENFLAMGLDSNKRQIRSIASNAGHCIAAGIVEERLIEPLIGRFIASDLFSGWGIRTLSAEHPAYNPYSYHRGSVWPVEQGTFAIGLMRYGFPKHVQLLAKAQFEAAELFNYCRLPELFSGHQRDECHPFPALYPNANWPQAWSASAVFSFVQAMLGLYAYAPLKLLLIDPHLPDWLPEITLKNLRVGKASLDIRFFLKSDGSSDYEIQDIRNSLHVIRQPSPWSLTATLPERAKDILVSLLPGK